MKWGIVSPNSKHFKNKMQWAFADKECVFSSRNPGEIELNAFGKVQSIALSKMLEQVDAVYVCTPTNTHYNYVSHALWHGKHVLVEKTFGVKFSEFFDCLEYAYRICKLEIAFQSAFKSFWTHSINCPNRPVSGFAKFTIPCFGEHPNPIWDVAFYPIMTAGYFGGNNLQNIEFRNSDGSWFCLLTFDRCTWELEWSVSKPFSQLIQVDGVEYTDCFTAKAGDGCYDKMISNFEWTGLHGVNRPVDVLQGMFPVFEEWQKYYVNEVVRSRLQSKNT